MMKVLLDSAAEAGLVITFNYRVRNLAVDAKGFVQRLRGVSLSKQ